LRFRCRQGRTTLRPHYRGGCGLLPFHRRCPTAPCSARRCLACRGGYLCALSRGSTPYWAAVPRVVPPSWATTHHPFSPCSIASTHSMLGTKRMVPRLCPAMLGTAYRWLPAGARREQREGAPQLIAGQRARYRPGWCYSIWHHAEQTWCIVCLGWCARPGAGRYVVGQCLRVRGKRLKCGASPTCSPLASPRRPAISNAEHGWHSRGTTRVVPSIYWVETI
jgi:hypothetical protein